MHRLLIGFATTLLMLITGCGEPTLQDSMGGDRGASEPDEQSVVAEVAADTESTETSAEPPAPNANESAAMPSDSTAVGEADAASGESASAQSTGSASENATDALQNFEAGIVAYQANDLGLAFKEFLTAANKGHSDSQYNLGLMYEQGIGTGKDETQAVAWYAKSASQGNSAAQFNLGVLYENGRGTKVDFAQANKWYRAAAVQRDPLAIGNLGMLYIRGDGVPVNKIAGVALLFMSATMDPSPSNNARQNITATRGLSTEMIASAQQLSSELSTAENLLVPLDRFLKQ